MTPVEVGILTWVSVVSVVAVIVAVIVETHSSAITKRIEEEKANRILAESNLRALLDGQRDEFVARISKLERSMASPSDKQIVTDEQTREKPPRGNV